MTRSELLTELQALQRAWTSQDIVTIAYCGMSDAALAVHVAFYRAKIEGKR